MKALTRIAAAIFIFLLIYFMTEYIYTPPSKVLAGRWLMTIDGKSEYVKVPFEIKIKHPTIVTLTKEFRTRENGDDTLVIPEINGGGFEVYLNGNLVYKCGDSVGVGNVWNEVHVIRFSPLSNEKNVLKVKIFALYNAGLAIVPYVGRYRRIKNRILSSRFFKYDIVLIMMGMALAVGLVLISLSFTNEKNRRKYFVIGMAAFFMSLYLTDLRYWFVESVITYMILRKVFVISLYNAVFLFFDGMEREIFGDLKLSKAFLAATILVSMYVAAQPTLFLFKRSLIIGALLSFAMITVTMMEVYIRKAYELVYPITLAFGIGLYIIFLTLNGKPNAFLISYVVMSLIGGVGIFITKDYSKTYTSMVLSHKAALTDPLTGVFNRKVLNELKLSSKDVIVMVDMDRFKRLNDRYGHDKGDEILKLFCRKCEENLRNEDFVVRYGGDEFLLILENCTKADAVNIAQRIKRSFEEESLQYGVTFSYGVERVGKGLKWALKKADSKMYAMKENSRPNREKDA